MSNEVPHPHYYVQRERNLLTMDAKYAILNAKEALQKRGECAMNTRIRELRSARRISQEELAAAVGTTRQTITSIETGKYTASLPLAYKIARYFGLSIEEVFDLKEVELPWINSKRD